MPSDEASWYENLPLQDGLGCPLHVGEEVYAVHCLRLLNDGYEVAVGEKALRGTAECPAVNGLRVRIVGIAILSGDGEHIEIEVTRPLRRPGWAELGPTRARGHGPARPAQPQGA